MSTAKRTPRLRFSRIHAVSLVALIPLTMAAAFFYVTSADAPAFFKPSSAAARTERIKAIYESLKLEPEYKLIDEKIIGEKRYYEWDKGRTYASARTYERDTDVSTTSAQIRANIEAAGFTYFEAPYPGAVYTQWHFKSKDNEYLRLTVTSKPRDDAFRVADSAGLEVDPNQGPSNIVIKINLDDNNE